MDGPELEDLGRLHSAIQGKDEWQIQRKIYDLIIRSVEVEGRRGEFKALTRNDKRSQAFVYKVIVQSTARLKLKGRPFVTCTTNFIHFANL